MSHPFLRMRRAFLGTALFLLTPVGIVWLAFSSPTGKEHACTPRLTAKQVADRTLALCITFCNTARLIEEPEFDDNISRNPSGELRHQHVWTIHCEADGKRYFFRFNDRTGNLIEFAPEISMSRHLALESSDFSLDTPASAANIGGSRLSALGLFPPGTLVKLKSAPHRACEGKAWRMVWQIQTAAPASLNEIDMVLAYRGGAPVTVINWAELKW